MCRAGGGAEAAQLSAVLAAPQFKANPVKTITAHILAALPKPEPREEQQQAAARKGGKKPKGKVAAKPGVVRRMEV